MALSMDDVRASNEKANKKLDTNLKRLNAKKFERLPDKTDLKQLKKAMAEVATYFKTAPFTQTEAYPTDSNFKTGGSRVVWTNVAHEKECILKGMPDLKKLKEYIELYTGELTNTVMALEDFDKEQVVTLMAGTFLVIDKALKNLLTNMGKSVAFLIAIENEYRNKADGEFWSSEEDKCDASADRMKEVRVWAEIQNTAVTTIAIADSGKVFMASLNLVMNSAKYSLGAQARKNNAQLVALVKGFKSTLKKQSEMYEDALKTIMEGYKKEIKELKRVLAKSQALNAKYETNLDSMITRMEKLNDVDGAREARKTQEQFVNESIDIETAIDDIIPAAEQIRIATSANSNKKLIIGGAVLATVVTTGGAFFFLKKDKPVEKSVLETTGENNE